MTFTNDDQSVAVIRGLMLSSHETFVNYTMPLGLHHLIGGDHYAPMPWNDRAPRADWTATYYHQASTEGIGFDRTKRGNRAVEQYFPPVCDLFDDHHALPGKVSALVPSLRVGLPDEVGQAIVGRTVREVPAGRGAGGGVADNLAIAGRKRLTRAATRRWPTAWPFRSRTLRNGATRFLEYFGRFSKKPVPPSNR